jgi:nucleoside-diphosphate-sugar epimerase
MKVTVIGTNGLLSDSIGRYCNMHNHELSMYGLAEPERHLFHSFSQINLINENLDYTELSESDMIVYAAGAGIQSNLKESADLIYTLNVTVPVKICNELNSIGYKGVFISFGSYFEIGENEDDHCFTEIELLQSQKKVVNHYSVSKRMFSRFISSVEMLYKSWHFILPTIYGEYESPQRLIPYTINALKSGKEIGFTSGDQVRQYIYIDEVVDIIFMAYTKNIPSGVYNVSGSETFTVKELVTKLFDLTGKPLAENVFGKTERTDTGMKNLQLNGEKLYNAIAYQPKVKLIDVYDRY